jgi:hypothetical protein
MIIFKNARRKQFIAYILALALMFTLGVITESGGYEIVEI